MVGILSIFLILIINPQRQLEKARDAKRFEDLTQIRNALDTYYNDHNCYPALLDSLTTGKTYIKEIPKDPDTQAYYQYETDNTDCPQWNVLFAKVSSPSDIRSSCPLDQLSNCVPQGYDSSEYACLLSGKVDCSYIGSKPLPTPVVPTPTIIPTPTPSTVPTPTATLTPIPTPTITPTPTIPACSPLYACTSSGEGTRCNVVDSDYVRTHPATTYYCVSNCDGVCID